MSGNVAVRRGDSRNSGRFDCCGKIYGLAANSTKPGVGTVQLTTMRTNRFEPHPAVIAKDRIRQILALTSRANHNGNQSQMGRVVPNSIKPDLGERVEDECILPGVIKSKLRGYYNIG